MSSSSNFSTQGNQAKGGRVTGHLPYSSSVDQSRDSRESRSLQSQTLRMGTLVPRNTASPTAPVGPAKTGTLRATASPKGIKDSRMCVSDTVQSRTPFVAMDTQIRVSKNRSLVQGREITSRSWAPPMDAGTTFLGPRSPTVLVNPSIEVSVGPSTRLSSSGMSSPFLVVGAGDEGIAGSEVSMGSARSQKALLSARGLVASSTARRGWTAATMANVGPDRRPSAFGAGWAAASSSAISSHAVSSTRGSALSLHSAVQLLENFSSKQEDRVLQHIFRMFVSRLDLKSHQTPVRNRVADGSERSMRVAETATQTDEVSSAESEFTRQVSSTFAECVSCDGSGHESGWLLSPRESCDEWGDGRTNSSVASVSSRVASSTAASQCTTLPFDPADYEACNSGNIGSFYAESTKIDREGWSTHATVDEKRDKWTRNHAPSDPSLDALQELQRYIDLQYMRIMSRKGPGDEGSPTSTHARTIRASPGPWSPATMEIRRLAQDALARAESPALGGAAVAHPQYRPPNPGGSNGSGRFGVGEQARADSDSLSSSGTPASSTLKLTPRLSRNPPLHATRVSLCSRDGGGGGSAGGGGGSGSTDGVSPRVPPSETLTPRPGPGSSGDSPISTPRDRSAFLAPSKVVGRSSGGMGL